MKAARSTMGRALFAEWQRVRGTWTELGTRAFSRGWEELLESAGLTSAIERSDAERDARELSTGGWVELKTVPYRPQLIARIAIPLPAEPNWCEAFGFVPPSDEEARQIRDFPWEPRLTFLRTARLNIRFSELHRLNEFLTQANGDGALVPIKERSLQIFGDEKRLDELLASALFRPDRLALKRDLRCEVIGVPLAWKRGPSCASRQPLMVIENAATWHSYCRWNAERSLFSGVVFGDGNRFADGVRYLPDIFAELDGPRRILYFGDLDPQGLRIPQEASGRSQAAGLPPVEPHLFSYRHLLTLGNGRGQPWEGEPPSLTLCDWLGDCAESARQLFAAGQRLAQEHVGWEFLQQIPGSDAITTRSPERLA